MVLQDLVQPFYPQSAFPHRRHYLNFIFLCLDVAGKLFLDQSNGGTYDSIRIVAADEKKSRLRLDRSTVSPSLMR